MSTRQNHPSRAPLRRRPLYDVMITIPRKNSSARFVGLPCTGSWGVETSMSLALGTLHIERHQSLGHRNLTREHGCRFLTDARVGWVTAYRFGMEAHHRSRSGSRRIHRVKSWPSPDKGDANGCVPRYSLIKQEQGVRSISALILTPGGKGETVSGGRAHQPYPSDSLFGPGRLQQGPWRFAKLSVSL